MTEKPIIPMLAFASQKDWERWLARNHGKHGAIWMKLAKKDSGIPSVTYPEALEAALCHGWIDGQKASIDEQYWKQWFGPRQARSKWSKINCDKATRLIQEGRMNPAGLAEIERAKADGRWDAAYAGQRIATVPDDLQDALDANPAASQFFKKLKSHNRYAILFRVHDAKRPETRARRIAQFVQMLAEGKTLH